MYCMFCGIDNPDDAQFCRSCGKAIGEEQPLVQPQVSAPAQQQVSAPTVTPMQQQVPAQAQAQARAQAQVPVQPQAQAQATPVQVQAPAPVQAPQPQTPTQMPVAAVPVQMSQVVAVASQAKPKRNTAIIIAVVVAVVAILAVILGVFVFGGNNANGAGSGSQGSSAAPTEARIRQVYYAKTNEYIKKYGEPQLMTGPNGNPTELRGVCTVTTIDFDKDGTDELMVGYYAGDKSTPAGKADCLDYRVHVYEFADDSANLILDIPMNAGTNGGITYLSLYENNDKTCLLDEEHIDRGRDRDMTLLEKQGHEFVGTWTASQYGYGPTATLKVNGKDVSAEEFGKALTDDLDSHETCTFNFIQYGTPMGHATKYSPKQTLDLANETIEELAASAASVDSAKEDDAEAAKKQQEEAAKKLEQEKQAALDVNPDVIRVERSLGSSEFVKLTGVVDVQQGKNALGNIEDVVLLRLPKEITVYGTRIESISVDTIILWKEFAYLKGKTVQFNIKVYDDVSAGYASSQYSPIISTSGTSVVNVFDDSGNGSATTPVDRDQLAVEVAEALFDKGTYANDVYTPKDMKVSQYLAPGSSAAANYANGWPSIERSVFSSAKVTSSNGSTYDVEVVFEVIRTGEIAERNGAAKVYIARISLTFDQDNKVTDITGKVV